MSQNDHHPRHSHRPRLLKLGHPSNISRALPSTQTIKHGWAPTGHIFLTTPSLSRTHILQAHLRRPSVHHRFLNHPTPLLAHPPHPRPIRLHPHAPAPRQHAPNDLPPPQRVLRLPHTLHTLQSSTTTIVVAFPLLWALLAPSASASASASSSPLDPESAPASRASRPGPGVHLLRITHARAHRAWLLEGRLEELRRWGGGWMCGCRR